MQMLIINCSPDVEDALVDLLLDIDAVPGFTTVQARGHGPGGELSIAEQVAGRRNRIQVYITLDDALVRPCLQQLAAALPSPDIRYWVTPVIESGRLNEVPAD